MPLGLWRKLHAGEIDTCDGDRVRFEAGVDGQQVAQGAREQQGAEQQDERERHLRDRRARAAGRRLRAIPVTLRALAFMASWAATLEARHAGIKPKVRQVSTAIVMTKAIKRASKWQPKRQAAAQGIRAENDSTRWRTPGRPPPPRWPAGRSRPSSWRTRRLHDAPIANRTENSRSRAEARARIRLARFVQAMSRTSADVTSKTRSGLPYRVRSADTPALAGDGPQLEAQIVVAVFRRIVGRHGSLEETWRGHRELRVDGIQ